jgi:hypothetical protein
VQVDKHLAKSFNHKAVAALDELLSEVSIPLWPRKCRQRVPCRAAPRRAVPCRAPSASAQLRGMEIDSSVFRSAILLKLCRAQANVNRHEEARLFIATAPGHARGAPCLACGAAWRKATGERGRRRWVPEDGVADDPSPAMALTHPRTPHARGDRRAGASQLPASVRCAHGGPLGGLLHLSGQEARGTRGQSVSQSAQCRPALAQR